jgi:hypothetical protein
MEDKQAEKKERKVRRIKPYTPKWEKLANQLARSWNQLKPCRYCGYPVTVGYCCGTCGSDNP